MYDLRLTPEVFWRLTPRQFAALCDRLRDERYREDYRAALVAYVVAEAHRNPKQRRKPFSIEDFMPAAAEREQTPEQQAAILLLATAATRAAFSEG